MCKLSFIACLILVWACLLFCGLGCVIYCISWQLWLFILVVSYSLSVMTKILGHKILLATLWHRSHRDLCDIFQVESIEVWRRKLWSFIFCILLFGTCLLSFGYATLEMQNVVWEIIGILLMFKRWKLVFRIPFSSRRQFNHNISDSWPLEKFKFSCDILKYEYLSLCDLLGLLFGIYDYICIFLWFQYTFVMRSANYECSILSVPLVDWVWLSPPMSFDPCCGPWCLCFAFVLSSLEWVGWCGYTSSAISYGWVFKWLVVLWGSLTHLGLS